MGDVLFAFLPSRAVWLVLGGAAALLTLLYLLRLRRRRAEVPFLRLWAEAAGEAQSSALLRRLRRLWSLLLALLFAALLALAAADPRREDPAEARSIVLLVDTSASMEATDVAPAPSRLARAVELALGYVDGMRAADAAMVVRVDGQAAPVTPFTRDRDALREALRGLRATDTRADFAAALSLAGAALAGLPRPALAVFGDLAIRGESALGLPDLSKRGVAVALFGVGSGAGRNAGITAFSVRRYLADRTAFEVFGSVRSFSTAPLRVAVRLYLDGAQVGERHLELPPGETVPLVVEDVTVGDAAHDGRLSARLALEDGTTDDLPADDVAYAVVPPHAKVRALVAGRENLFLEAALVVGESVAYDHVDCAAYDAAKAAAYDVTILDGCSPGALESGRYLLLDVAGAAPAAGAGAPAPGAAPAAASGAPAPGAAPAWPTGAPLAFPRLAVAPGRAKHPVLRWVTLKDVAVAEVHPLVTARGDETLLVAGAAAKPALVARADGAFRAVAFGFDVRKSDLPLRVAFPLLVLNAIDWLTASGDDAYRASLRAGQVFEIPLPPGASAAAPPETAELTTPSGIVRTVPVHEGRAVLYAAERGFYTLRSGGGALLLAANLADADESDVRPAVPPPIAGAPGALVTRAADAGDWWRWLLLAALALTLVEWWTYNRRLTV